MIAVALRQHLAILRKALAMKTPTVTLESVAIVTAILLHSLILQLATIAALKALVCIRNINVTLLCNSFQI